MCVLPGEVKEESNIYNENIIHVTLLILLIDMPYFFTFSTNP
ncbi:hypothetical protein AC26_3292 [Escherichia coli 1-176-05_S3_C2]|nr:hypothetical protein AC26_3292 [Escherichia coli 1-176-05_S3_C2]